MRALSITGHPGTNRVLLDRPTATPRWRALLLAGGRRNRWVENVVLVLGAASIVVSALIHLHLWMNGYSGIHIIGPLFLVQALVGLVLAASVLWFRQVWTSVLGAGYLVASFVGFLLAVHGGLFGFQDAWSAPFAMAAFWDEVIGAPVLLVGGTVCSARLIAGGWGHQPAG